MKAAHNTAASPIAVTVSQVKNQPAVLIQFFQFSFCFGYTGQCVCGWVGVGNRWFTSGLQLIVFPRSSLVQETYRQEASHHFWYKQSQLTEGKQQLGDGKHPVQINHSVSGSMPM